MEPQQRCFDTFARMILTYQYADMAPCEKSATPPLYGFFTNLYEDMLAHPGAYHLPSDPFITYYRPLRGTLTPEETAQHEELKATSIRVRKPMIANFEFLRDLGLAGEPANTDLQLPRAAFDRLVGDYAKKNEKSPFSHHSGTHRALFFR